MITNEGMNSLIVKLNQYAKDVNITNNDIWRMGKKDQEGTRYRVAYAVLGTLNEKINRLGEK